MGVEGNTKLEDRLQAFSTRAKRIAPACDNEEQTKVSLVNPYLEILGYDVRDPHICRLEYTADIGKSGERVDYAIMRSDRPVILIEAKAATVSMTNEAAPAQLQRYFLAEQANFAALTNGLVWQWYRARDRDRVGWLREVPFLVHDVREPGQQELPFLRSVSGPEFNIEGAHARAEEASLATALTDWIVDTRRNPGDDLLRVVIGDLNLGRADARRIERVRRSFVSAFNAYVDGEADRLLDAAREQHRAEPERQDDLRRGDGGGAFRSAAAASFDGRRSGGDRVSASDPGRPSRYSGKTIRAKVDSNPRRVGSHGFRSMEIILGAMPQGIVYEEYRARGGRTKDLAWDIARGWTEVVESSRDRFSSRPTAGAGGRVTVRDAMYLTLKRIGRDGGVKAKVLRETAEKTFDLEITSKTAGNALWFLKQEGKIRRKGYFWYLADAPTAS